MVHVLCEHVPVHDYICIIIIIDMYMYVYVFMHVHVYVYVYSTKFTYVCCGLCVILHVHVCPFIFNVVHDISHVWYAALYMYIQFLLSLSLSLSFSSPLLSLSFFPS